MAYQVIARKWRPQSFSELVGQDHISTTLRNALKNQRLPQVLLFTGPRGTGKTSTARILAKSLVCSEAQASSTFIPCHRCSSCQEIATGRSLDVLEIDGASNNGVDAIRELREGVGYRPANGAYKIYIIDEVHMLSTSAFNALLKTLEEPPEHVIFILATTEVQKIPATVLSRCQRFDFRRISTRQIAEQLEKICRAENIPSDDQALWAIARQADGSMRDAQSLLDQVSSFTNGELHLEQVIEVLGLTDRTLLLETLAALAERDTPRILGILEKIYQAGFSASIFAQDLLEEIRHALMLRLLKPEESASRLVDLPESEIQTLREITHLLTPEDLHFLFDMGLKGTQELLRAQDPRLVLEMLLLRMSAAPRLLNLTQTLSNPLNNQGVGGGFQQTQPQHTLPPQTQVPSQARAQKIQPQPQPQPQPQHQPQHQLHPQPQPQFQSQPAPTSENWCRFVEDVKKANAFLGALLENTQIVAAEDGRLRLAVPAKMNFLTDQLREVNNRKRIEQFLKTFWGQTYQVELVSNTSPSSVVSSNAKNSTRSNASPQTSSSVTGVTGATPREIQEQRETQKRKEIESSVLNHPFVRSTQELFKTQIKSIKEMAQHEI